LGLYDWAIRISGPKLIHKKNKSKRDTLENLYTGHNGLTTFVNMFNGKK